MDKPLINHLQAMRRLRGLTQEALAQQLGVQRSVISDWERGVVMPTIYWALRLADALVCRVEEIFSLPPR